MTDELREKIADLLFNEPYPLDKILGLFATELEQAEKEARICAKAELSERWYKLFAETCNEGNFKYGLEKATQKVRHTRGQLASLTKDRKEV